MNVLLKRYLFKQRHGKSENKLQNAAIDALQTTTPYLLFSFLFVIIIIYYIFNKLLITK